MGTETWLDAALDEKELVQAYADGRFDWLSQQRSIGCVYPHRSALPPRPHIPTTIRACVLERGGCAHCGSTKKLELDHIIPFSKGGGDEPENLQPLCERCNRSKGNRWVG